METLKLMRSSARGQAAITDALFFLLIVSALCALLFLFANDYGTMVSEAVKRSYGADYSTSALKTILYSSVPRSSEERLAEAQEIDYLLAALKEDYAYAKNNRQKISPKMQKILYRNVNAIMEPLAEQFDYLFYIYYPNAPSHADEFPYMLLHLSLPSGESQHVDYICAPKSAGGSALPATVDYLMALIPNSAQAVSNIWLSEADIAEQDIPPRRITTRISLTMWPAVDLQQEINFNPAPWNCCNALLEGCPAE